MKEEIKQTGLIIDFPKPTDYVAGKETPIKAIKNPSGDWTPYHPKPENQFAATFDTMSCTTFSACNSVEMLIKFLPDSAKAKLRELGFDEDFNISDKFVAIMSGTTKQGNTFGKVADTIRTVGFIPEQDLPFGDAKTWDEYHNPAQITDAMKAKALKVLEVLDIFYDWVFFDQNPDFTDDQYTATDLALKSAPVQIGIQTPATHAINLTKLEKKNNVPFYTIFDHYPNYVFQGDAYKPHFGLRYSVEEKVVVQLVYPTYTFTKYLVYGLRNNSEVKMLQQVLIVESCLSKGLDTGNFYDQTLQAVKKFQAKYGIETTGTVGPKTRAKLNELCQKKTLNNSKDFGLKPLLKRKSDEFIAACKKAGFDVCITEGFRSLERQQELYDQGRTKPGYIVTNAKPGQSLHNYGVAFDVAFVKNGVATFTVPESYWQAIGKIGQSIGLEWGGSWASFIDRPHFQMMLGYSLNDFINKRIDWNKYN